MPILQLDPDKPLGKKMQQLQTYFFLLLGLPLILFLVAYLRAEQPGFQASYDWPQAAHLLIWAIVLGTTFYAWRRANNPVKLERNARSLEDKFGAYSRVNMQSYGLLVLCMLIISGLLWLGTHVLYAGLFSIVLIAMASIRPGAEQFIQRMKLSTEEQAELLEQE